jgi:GDP-4-dehydro-6-deoxy-D-mannose reductase
VTGASGFVGRHLLAQLEGGVSSEGDVRDADAIGNDVRSARPDWVIHLAGASSVSSSWDKPGEAWSVNAVGTVNLLAAVRAAAPKSRMVFASTGEVYGRAPSVPTNEDTPLAPVSPYAASKAAAEIACAQARRAGLDVVVARAFQHEGPGRDERFAIGSWTRQIAELEQSGGGVLKVGDLSGQRDITDVRDACRAYHLLLDPSVPADTYNMASGKSVSMEEVVGLLIGLADCPIEVEQDPERMRPVDVPIVCGDPSRLREATGWVPEIPLRQTLADALDYARSTVTERQR